VVKVANTGNDIVRAADAALDAAKAAEIAGDVTKARKAADAADAAVDATRRGLQGAEATGDATKIAEAQANYQKAQDAAREAREAAERACFVAGTLILTPTGYQAIETLQAGDWVLAGNPETGEVKQCRVLQTFEREVSQVLDVRVGDETITCTAEHPFWVSGKGWVKAGQLAVGDLLMTQKQEIIQVEQIAFKPEQVKVYNFGVGDFHTYFVSRLSILVHNTCDGNLNWSPLSKPTFGHTFETHGVDNKNTQRLRGRAAGTNQSQGQWLNNQAAADLLREVAEAGDLSGPATITIPDGLGQVIKPDGSIVPATHATIVPKAGGGYKTAYPIAVE
jgi:hypothetical protein